jgi:hypothetical protein
MAMTKYTKCSHSGFSTFGYYLSTFIYFDQGLSCSLGQRFHLYFILVKARPQSFLCSKRGEGQSLKGKSWCGGNDKPMGTISSSMPLLNCLYSSNTIIEAIQGAILGT